MYELFSRGGNPWPGIGNAQVIEDLSMGKRMTFPSTFGPDFILEKIEVCWKENPHERPTFTELLNQLNSFHSNSKKTGTLGNFSSNNNDEEEGSSALYEGELGEDNYLISSNSRNEIIE